MNFKAVFLSLAFLALVINIHTAVSSEAFQDQLIGRKVGKITFSIASPYTISFLELSSVIGISPGETLTKERVEKSIKALNKKGIFKSILLYGEIVNGKVDLIFDLDPFVSLRSVKVLGSKYFSGKEILSKLRIRKGTPLSELDIDGINKRLATMYEANGYFHMRSDIKVGCDLERGTGALLISVEEGNQPKLKEIEISGNSVISDEDIKEILLLIPGEIVNVRKVKERLSKLQKEYRRKGYLTFRAGNPAISEIDGGVRINLSVREGARYELDIVGNVHYDKGSLIKASGLLIEPLTFEAGIIERVERNLDRFYKAKGYPFITVSATIVGKEKRKLVVQVDEGIKGVIKNIDIQGGRSIKAKEVRGVMDTGVRRFYSFITGSGIYDSKVFENDLEKVRGLYQSQGFPNAKVSGDVNRLDGNKGLNLGIIISEGNHYHLQDIKLKNVTFFADSEILKLLGNVRGRPIDYVAAYADVYTIQKLYRDAGFDDCKVKVSFDIDEPEKRITIIYDISEGDRFVLGRVVITGNTDVSSRVILRELPVKRGEVLGESSLIEFQQKLYRTGMFRNIKIDQLKDYGTKEMNLLIHVEESKFLLLTAGGGYGTDTGFVGSMSFRHININGLGRTLGSRLEVSQKQFLLNADMVEPWVFGWNVDGTLSLTSQKSEEESFDLEEYTAVGGITKKFWERSSFSLQLEFDRSRTFNVAPDATLSPEDIGNKNFVLLRPILVFDERNDPFYPTSGTYNSILLEFSVDFLGSSRGYYKVTSQSSYYRSLGKSFVLALSARGGYANPFSGEALPIDRRFFSGGRTTVRGFKEDFLGPVGVDGSPVGGDTEIILNGEIRYSIAPKFVLGLFVDAGSVWLRDVDIYGFDLRETAGYTIKYITPVGPVSFDMGFKLDRRAGESSNEYYFTIGSVF